MPTYMYTFLLCLFLCAVTPFATHAAEKATSGNKGASHPKTRQLCGKASWYGEDFHGGTTASGIPYDMHTFTAAHKTLPFGTVVEVTEQNTGRKIMVCITDRGPFKPGRIIDLSYAAATELGMSSRGIAPVDLRVVSDTEGNSLFTDQAFYVRIFRKPDGKPEMVGPFMQYADAAVMQEALQSQYPEANIVMDYVTP